MSDSVGRIELPPKLIPVFQGDARYRVAYGGRGSGKTRAFALMTAVHGYRCGMAGQEGQILCAREFMNSLDESSLEEIKSAIRSVPWLLDYYEIGEKFIRSRDGRVKYTFAGLRHNIDSIKSKARILLCWIDEAETVSEEAWVKLVPTVREDNSEIWVSYNPESKRSSTHKRFREDPPQNSRIVELNWRDNPWFPDVLDQERLDDQEKRPHSYAHIWEGDFNETLEGAYYAEQLTAARAEGRIGKLSIDPLHEVRAFWDIGGTGRLSDACAIWVAQFVGKEVRVLAYYEAQGQELGDHVAWLRAQGYAGCTCVLPHDGATKDKVYRVSYQSSLEEAGFPVVVIPNQGAGAAKGRIEALRRLLPSMWFDAARCEAGLEALKHYHEKVDERRGIGLGPHHDWSSHGADAAGLIAIAYSVHNPQQTMHKPKRRGAWAL
ncbi:terminase large subunit [Paracoccus phage vB_PmaP_KLEP18-1]|nr:terminase large subunit [Paracoccus phage vB_PmaP_KLEP18-1]